MAKRKSPIRESVRSWFFDRYGTLWLNVRSVRRRPLSKEEWAAIDKAVEERAARGAAEDAVH